MTRLEEIKEIRKARREADKKVFMENLNVIEYKEKIGAIVNFASVCKDLDGKIYNFGVTNYENGAIVYDMSVSNGYLESAHYTKQYVNETPPIKWNKHYEELRQHIISKKGEK